MSSRNFKLGIVLGMGGAVSLTRLRTLKCEAEHQDPWLLVPQKVRSNFKVKYSNFQNFINDFKTFNYAKTLEFYSSHPIFLHKFLIFRRKKSHKISRFLESRSGKINDDGHNNSTDYIDRCHL